MPRATGDFLRAFQNLGAFQNTLDARVPTCARCRVLQKPQLHGVPTESSVGVQEILVNVDAKWIVEVVGGIIGKLPLCRVYFSQSSFWTDEQE